MSWVEKLLLEELAFRGYSKHTIAIYRAQLRKHGVNGDNPAARFIKKELFGQFKLMQE